MTHDDERFAGYLRGAAHDYNNPPELSRAELDDMWSAIEDESFGKKPFSSPSPDATFNVRRRTFDVRRWLDARALFPLAAVLIIGIAIGRFGLPRKQTLPPMMVSRAAAADTVAMPEPYQTTTSRYLGQTAALLATLPAEMQAGQRSDEQFIGHAHDLLLTTRLLLDSPAAADPRFRSLLEDLELVLAQIVRLQSDQSRSELELIRQALEQRDVLPRLRNAAADISADN